MKLLIMPVCILYTRQNNTVQWFFYFFTLPPFLPLSLFYLPLHYFILLPPAHIIRYG
jgi:hypothetical protein